MVLEVRTKLFSEVDPVCAALCNVLHVDAMDMLGTVIILKIHLSCQSVSILLQIGAVYVAARVRLFSVLFYFYILSWFWF